MKAKAKIGFAVLLVIFIYTLFPAPLLQKNFWSSKSFVALSTVSGVILFVCSIGNNILLVSILTKVRIPFGSVNYLIIMMCIADIVYPVCYLPLMLGHTWIMYTDVWLEIDIELFFDYWRFFSSAYYLAAGVSASTFTLACAQRTYTIVIKKQDYIAFRYKFIAVCLSLAYGTILFVLNQEYTDFSEWVHLLDSIMIVFFPLTMSFILLATLIIYQNYVLRERVSSRNLNYVAIYGLYIIYFVCFLPLSMAETLHLYMNRVEFEHYVRLQYILPILFILKSPFNLMIVTSLDKRFMTKLEEIFSKVCCCQNYPREPNINAENETFHMYSELQEFHLSQNRIDMYSDSSAAMADIRQLTDNSDLQMDETDLRQLIIQESV
uniref:Uncharacterized protein n=1 Tax=Clytia hemisphaerica TaxID=252671 RepID=A0A7M5WJU8_9CNID|eukprot:TCONS_00045857-protein